MDLNLDVGIEIQESSTAGPGVGVLQYLDGGEGKEEERRCG